MKITVKLPASVGASITAKIKPLVQAAFADATPKIAALVVDRVVAEAHTKLHSMAEAYVHAVQDPDAIKVDADGVSIHIKDPIVLALEAGVNSFDIKAKMLPHARHFGKNGVPYVDVPFSHRPYGKGFRGGPDAVPKNVLRSLHNKANTAIAKSGPHDGQVRSNAHGAPPRSFERTLTFNGKSVTTQVQHKSGKHDNMIYGFKAAPGGRSYKTIRRISGNSDPMSWWHPGFPALNIFNKVFASVKRDINRIIGDSFARHGLKASFK